MISNSRHSINFQGLMLAGQEILKKNPKEEEKISSLAECLFAKFLFDLDQKLNIFCVVAKEEEKKRLGKKWDELKGLILKLQDRQPKDQQISKIFVDSVLRKIDSLNVDQVFYNNRQEVLKDLSPLDRQQQCEWIATTTGDLSQCDLTDEDIEFLVDTLADNIDRNGLSTSQKIN